MPKTQEEMKLTIFASPSTAKFSGHVKKRAIFFCTQEARIVTPITLKTINLLNTFGILAINYGNHKT